MDYGLLIFPRPLPGISGSKNFLINNKGTSFALRRLMLLEQGHFTVSCQAIPALEMDQATPVMKAL